MTRPTRAQIATLVVGLVAAAAVSAAVGADRRHAVELLAVTGLGALAAAAVTRFVMRRGRRRTLRVQVLTISATATAAMVGGILAAARAMFLSTHDLNVLVIVTVLSATVSVLAAQRAADRFDTDARTVAEMTGRFSAGMAHDDLAGDQSWEVAEMGDLATRLGEASSALARSTERERALEHSRRELIAWVSHDLRSPIASIRAVAEALEDGMVDNPDDIARYHRSIQVESARLGRLVDDLFELSRIQAGTSRPDGGAGALVDLADEALGGVTAAASARDVALECDLDGLDDVGVPASDMARVLTNLLDNAVRHTRDGGQVRLSGRLAVNGVEVAVRDGCGGIAADEIPRVFDAAFRGDPSRIRTSGGGGLGLTIARGLVEAHGGTISVANEGDGCCFTVRLPLGASAHAPIAAPAGDQRASGRSESLS